LLAQLDLGNDMDEENEDGAALMIYCDRHKQRSRSAVVCCHLAGGAREASGFVENSDDPDDLQAWCGRCEDLFLEEDDMTERFREFNDMRLVCEFCYADIKQRHAA
jgi:hypothetical protein